jgi:hypothetical protein
MDWKNSLYLYNILVTREFQGSKNSRNFPRFLDLGIA